jgi:hypothetical protein
VFLVGVGTLGPIATAATLINPASVPAAILGAFFISLMLSPALALGIFGWVSFLMWRLQRKAAAEGAPDKPIAPVWPAGWFIAYAAAWAAAVEQAVKAYRALPTTQPSRCYVATAAARGHRRFVRARVVEGMVVNDQLRRLKLGELALAAVAPRVHVALRKVYDQVGPVLASALVAPILADMAYVLLKPAEWSVVVVLRRLLTNFDAVAASLYLGRGAAPAEKDRT